MGRWTLASSKHFYYPGEPLEEGAIRVTLLGTGTPFPRRDQACAGIFVEAGAHKFLLDVGPGVPANFTSLEIPFNEVDKIFLTHHHVDHIGGLDHFWIGGWTYGRRRPLRVWGPPGTADIISHFRAIYEWDIEIPETLEDIDSTATAGYETIDDQEASIREMMARLEEAAERAKAGPQPEAEAEFGNDPISATGTGTD